MRKNGDKVIQKELVLQASSMNNTRDPWGTVNKLHRAFRRDIYWILWASGQIIDYDRAR